MNEKISYIGATTEKIDELIELLGDDIYTGYVGFPHYKYNGQLIYIDALLVTKYGVLALIDSFTNRVNPDNVFSKIEITLKNEPFLVSNRKLVCDIKVLIISEKTNIRNEEFASIKELFDYYIAESKSTVSRSYFRNIVHAIEGGLSKEKKTRSDTEYSHTIQQLESAVATFDKSQLECLRDREEKIQVISGLAGSGKTVILCKKISELLINEDDKKICITFYSRSLKKQIYNFIKKFLDNKTDNAEELLERVDIMNSWGNSLGDGFYSMMCIKTGETPIPLYMAKAYDSNNPFYYCCKDLYDKIEKEDKIIKSYDYIFVDEAQDLNEYFLKICYMALNDGGKLIYAYDEFQDLNDTIMKSPDEIFDTNSFFITPLNVCYRTPKEILITAHSIGMGLNSKQGICQFFEKEETWKTIGYSLSKSGEYTIADRETPSVFLEIDCSNLISTYNYENIQELEKQLVSFIRQDLHDGLLTEDIMIVDLAMWQTSNNYELFKNYSSGIFETSLSGERNPNLFFEKNKIVYSYVHRAKGNEAYKVYVVNSQLAMSSYLRDTWRNRLFTAMTRSMYQVVLLSINGEECSNLLEELGIVKQNGYKLKFIYPNQEEISKVKTVVKQNWKTYKAIDDTSEGLERLKMLDINEQVEHISSLLKGKFDNKTLEKIVDLLKKDEQN